MIRIHLLTCITISVIAFPIVIYSEDNKKTECIKFASKYIEEKRGIVTRCRIDKENNIFHCQDNRENYDVKYYYRDWSDFIKERKYFGSILQKKQIKNLGDTSIALYYSYDNKSRLVQEKSSTLIIDWLKWDTKGRHIKGKMNHLNNCLNRKIEVTYDEKKKIIKIITSKGKEISDNGCKKLPLLMYFEYDSNGNLLRKIIGLHNGLIKVENYKILEYKNECY
jgi:hypothetical protein